LASSSPKTEVARLAGCLLQKWKSIIDDELFRPLPTYDAVAAAEAPDGEPEAPQDEIAAIKVQKRMDKLERRRQRDAEMLDDTSSDDSDMPAQEEEEDLDWGPQKAAKRASMSSRRSRGSVE
jgi:hypothetical protein